MPTLGLKPPLLRPLSLWLWLYLQEGVWEMPHKTEGTLPLP